MIMEIFKYRDLLAMLVKRDIRIRYKQAAMGFMWALFMPIVAVASGVIVKKAMAVISGNELDFLGIVSITVKVMPWTFFSSAIRFAVQSLVGNANLVTKIYFPREVLPLAAMAACVFDHILAIGVLVVLLSIAKIGVSVHLLWLPVLYLLMFIFTAGLGLLLAAGNLFYRDVKYVVQVLLTFGIFFTPVFYASDEIGKWGVILLINPIGSMLELINQVVVLQIAPNYFWFGYAAIVSVLTFVLGIHIFHKKEPLFAENI